MRRPLPTATQLQPVPKARYVRPVPRASLSRPTPGPRRLAAHGCKNPCFASFACPAPPNNPATNASASATSELSFRTATS